MPTDPFHESCEVPAPGIGVPLNGGAESSQIVAASYFMFEYGRKEKAGL